MNRHQRILATLLTFMAVFSLAASPVTNAFGPTSNIKLYLTPATQSPTTKSAFQVKVMVDPRNRTYGSVRIDGSLKFPNTLLNVSSISTANTDYPQNINTNFNNATGTINFDQWNYFTTDASVYLFSINFTTLSNTGKAAVNFSSTTRAQNGTPVSMIGGTYTIVAPPPPACPAGTTGTYPNCKAPSPASKPQPKPTPQPTPPVVSDPPPVPILPNEPIEPPLAVPTGDLSITDIKADMGRLNGTLTWKNSISGAVNKIAVGRDKTKLGDTQDATKNQDGVYTANLSDLEPGVKYYYLISAIVPTNPGKPATYSDSFITAGYPIRLTVTEHGKVAPNAKITINGKTLETDSSGNANIELANRTYELSITLANKVTKKDRISVAKKAIADDGSVETQTFKFDLVATSQDDNSSNVLPVVATIGISSLGALGAGVYYFLVIRRHSEDESLATATQLGEDDEQLALPVMGDSSSGQNPGEMQAYAAYSSTAKYQPPVVNPTYAQPQSPEATLAYVESMPADEATQPYADASPEPNYAYDVQAQAQTAPYPNDQGGYQQAYQPQQAYYESMPTEAPNYEQQAYATTAVTPQQVAEPYPAGQTYYESPGDTPAPLPLNDQEQTLYIQEQPRTQNQTPLNKEVIV